MIELVQDCLPWRTYNGKLLVSATTELVILVEYGDQECTTYNKKWVKLTGVVTTCVGTAKLLEER